MELSAHTRNMAHYRTTRPPADPVQICATCWAISNLDTAGFRSEEADEWHCSVGCYQIRRLKDGRMDPQATPELFAAVTKMAVRHTPPTLVASRRAKARRLLARRIIRAVHDVDSGAD